MSDYKPPTSLEFLRHRELQCLAELKSIANRRAILRNEAMDIAGEWVCGDCFRPWSEVHHIGCFGPMA